MNLRFTVFGFEVWCLDFTKDDTDVVEDATPEGITGGSSLYTERDMDPPVP